MVARLTLNQLFGVQIPVPQLFTPAFPRRGLNPLPLVASIGPAGSFFFLVPVEDALTGLLYRCFHAVDKTRSRRLGAAARPVLPHRGQNPLPLVGG